MAFGATMLSFYLCLLNHPIYCLRLKLVEFMKLSDGDNRTICFMLLNS